MAMRCGMHRTTRDNTWVVALLAIVLKITTLPMAAAFGQLSLAQLLSGSYCSSGGTQYRPLAFDKDDNDSSRLTGQGHCCCSQAHGPMPLARPPALFPPTLALTSLPELFCAFQPSPRDCWPTSNPRASPVQGASSRRLACNEKRIAVGACTGRPMPSFGIIETI